MLATSKLEEWLRHRYFENDFDLSGSGVEDYSLREIIDLCHMDPETMQEIMFHDSPSSGCAELRKAVSKEIGLSDEDQILIGHGSSEIITLAMISLLDKGDRVIVQTPAYHALSEWAPYLECEVIPWELKSENCFKPDMDKLSELIKMRPKMVVVNFPHNPTGTTLSLAEQLRLVDLCRKSNSYLLWDEALSKLVYESEPLPTVASLYENGISVGTLSKAYGLPGMRLGWCAANIDILSKLIKTKDYTSISVSPLTEFIATHVLKSSSEIRKRGINFAAQNRTLLGEFLQRSPQVSGTVPAGGVTAFLKLPINGRIFAERLLAKHRVLVGPGDCFAHGEFIRLGFGGRPDKFREGLARIESEIEELAIIKSRISVTKFALTHDENMIIDDLIVGVSEEVGITERIACKAVKALSARLPFRLRQFLDQLIRGEDSNVASLITGFQLGRDIGPTPLGLENRPLWDKPERRENVFFMLVSAYLGSPFGWQTQQDGKIVHDVLPIKAHKDMQIGSGSKQEISVHVEDAHSEDRAHFLGLLCLRNPDKIGTTLSVPDFSKLSTRALDILQSEEFEIKVDLAHEPVTDLQGKRKIRVISRVGENYEIRIDEYFMSPHVNPEARSALQELCRMLDNEISDIVLEPGDVLFVNNRRTVHGRRAFRAKFDGRDRWLKRINITRDPLTDPLRSS